jgi:hypothetical protein
MKIKSDLKIKSYLMSTAGFGILVGAIILAQPFVSHSQNQVPPTRVEVINTPLEIRNVEAPPCCVPKNPFRKVVHLVAEDGETAPYTHLDVPVGKRLVIENVSVFARVPHSQQVLVWFQFYIGDGSIGDGTFFRQDFPLTFQIYEGSLYRDAFVASQQIRLYVDSGTRIQFFGLRKWTGGTLEVDFSISGFLVDLP